MTELERLEAEKAKIQAQIDALPKVQSVKEEARERRATYCNDHSFAVRYIDGDYDNDSDMRAIIDLVQELRDAKERIAELEAREVQS